VVKALATGKIDLSFIPDALLGQVEYMGVWNATTNTPALANPPALSTKGDFYIANVAGTQFAISFEVGDWIISDGTAWSKVDNTDAVASVFGRIGAIVAANGDYTAAQVTNIPAGNIAALTVQAALNELDAEKQIANADLTAIAALTPANNDVLQRKAGAWTNRTLAQFLADLASVGTTFQPLDADLTAIAALSTTAFGRDFLVQANEAAARTKIAVAPYGRVTFSNANVTVAPTTVFLAQIGTLTAPRTALLPLANSVPAGWELIIADQSGTMSATNTIIIAADVGNTTNGAASTTMGSPYGWRRLISDGISEWSFDGGLLRSSRNLSDLADPAIARTNLGLWTTVMKTAIETRNNTTTLTADSTLVLAMAANTSYAIRVDAFMDTAATPDFKFRINGPAAPTRVRAFTLSYTGVSPAVGAARTESAYSATDNTMLATTAQNGGHIHIDLVIQNGANAGNFEFQWAQNTSDAGSTSVLPGSYLEWRQVV